MTADHEISDGSMKFGAIVVSVGAVFHEVLTRFWQHVTKYFQIERSFVSYNSDVALLFHSLVAYKVFINDGIFVL